MLRRRNELIRLAGRTVPQCSPQNGGKNTGARQYADDNKHLATSRNCHDLAEQSAIDAIDQLFQYL